MLGIPTWQHSKPKKRGARGTIVDNAKATPLDQFSQQGIPNLACGSTDAEVPWRSSKNYSVFFVGLVLRKPTQNNRSTKTAKMRHPPHHHNLMLLAAASEESNKWLHVGWRRRHVSNLIFLPRDMARPLQLFELHHPAAAAAMGPSPAAANRGVDPR